MEIKVQIPDTLNEITLAQYSKYLDIVDQYTSMREDKSSDSFYLLKTLEIFTGLNYEDGLNLKLSDVRRIVSKLEGLLSQKPELVREFTLGDTSFGFIPKLDDMTFGEYIDLDTNLSDWSEMYKAMAVLYRPIQKKYDGLYTIEPYKGDVYYEAMKLMPLDAVFSSLLFFYHLGMELSIGMTKFLETESKELTLTQQRTLQENGVGISRSIHLLREMLQDIKL